MIKITSLPRSAYPFRTSTALIRTDLPVEVIGDDISDNPGRVAFVFTGGDHLDENSRQQFEGIVRGLLGWYGE